MGIGWKFVVVNIELDEELQLLMEFLFLSGWHLAKWNDTERKSDGLLLLLLVVVFLIVSNFTKKLVTILSLKNLRKMRHIPYKFAREASMELRWS